LSKSSPAEAGLKAVPKVQNYSPAAFVKWSYEQIEAVRDGRPVDEAVTEDVAEKLEVFAKERTDFGYSIMWLTLDQTRAVKIDTHFYDNASKLRSERARESQPFNWLGGISKGVIKGQLLSVEDDTGQREFFIVPPVGPERIKCIFPELLRQKVKEYLFETVEVRGLLHRTNKSPHPDLVEALDITRIDVGPALKDFETVLLPSDGGFSIDPFEDQ
jgi:hypothetical protein